MLNNFVNKNKLLRQVSMIELEEATSEEDFKTAVVLFKEYAASLGVNLEFQNFSEEIENLESQYSRPKGIIFLATENNASTLGCFGIRELSGPICELKRMYLRQGARGRGIGKLMLERSIEVGRELGYRKMRLDTLPTMRTAIKLYEKMGFYEIKPYRFNPIDGTKYFEINLIE